MGDSSERVHRVLEVLLPVLRTHPDLVVGDTTVLHHRGGGARIVFDLSLADGEAAAGDGPAEGWVRVEREDRPRRAGTRSRLGAGRRALPPGSSR
ncbi:hypothetical protein ACFV1W_25460 [Kitasatospora sp. NPDC059648]|uniref:hypothetical protein n=1 Tax=Kitasatospora sp. NPDC059648 TaxID=3346894 RepID=UPI00367D8464